MIYLYYCYYKRCLNSFKMLFRLLFRSELFLSVYSFFRAFLFRLNINYNCYCLFRFYFVLACVILLL